MVEPMWRHAFNVADTFWIEGRGLVATSDVPRREFPSWLALKVHDQISLRGPDGGRHESFVAGIELGGGRPDRPFAFLLPSLSKADVPIGTEVWVSSVSMRGGSPPD